MIITSTISPHIWTCPDAGSLKQVPNSSQVWVDQELCDSPCDRNISPYIPFGSMKHLLSPVTRHPVSLLLGIYPGTYHQG